MSQLKQITTPPSFSTQEELEALLLEGLNSGDPIDVTPEFWAGLHAELSNGGPQEVEQLAVGIEYLLLRAEGPTYTSLGIVH